MTLTKIDDRGLKTPIDLLDNEKIRLGTGNDLQIYHDGAHSYIQDAGSGRLNVITNQFNVKSSDNTETLFNALENGAVNLYYNNSKKLETTSAGIKVTGSGANAVEIKSGTHELYSYHDSSGVGWATGTGGNYGELIYLNEGAGSVAIYASQLLGLHIQSTSTELYYSGSKKLETQLFGINVSGDVFIPDNNRFVSGNSNDIQLYHSGIDSFLLHIGTGNLKLQTNSGSIELNSANENMIKAVPNGAVELYHDNSKKLETTSTGIKTESSSDVVFRLTKTGASDAEIKNTNSLDLCCSSGGSGGQVIRFLTGANPSSLIEHSRLEGGGHMLFHQAVTATPGLGNTTAGASVEKISGGAGSAIFVSRTAGTPLFVNRNTDDGFVMELRRQGNGVGNISVTTSSASFNSTSDYRLKENVTAISDGITRLKTLKPYRFNFIIDPDKTVDGFFAHEVTAVPEAITGTKDEVDKDNKPVYQGIDQSKLVPLLTAALQEEISKRESLETRVAALEAA